MSRFGLMDWDGFTRRVEKWGDEPLSVAGVDVDDFKSVNDKHGHEVGDALLELVARKLKGESGDGVWVSRRGGDEFACAFPHIAPEQALLALDEVRRDLSGRKHRVSSASIPIAISVGIAGFPQHVEEPAELIAASEAALARAKREGRNRVAIYVEEKMVLKSNYYPRAQLARLSSLAGRMDLTEAALLREALSELLDRHRQAI